jgi:restriction system protein
VRDKITARIREEFSGHGLATLVTAILDADGYLCSMAPPGPDGGVDITAGRGPLGLDSPRVLAQVKAGGADIGVVNQLQGVMPTHGAEQGLLVAWNGLTKPARQQLSNQSCASRSGRRQTLSTPYSAITTSCRRRSAARCRYAVSGCWPTEDVTAH